MEINKLKNSETPNNETKCDETKANRIKKNELQKRDVRLIALDLDGTLFNEQGVVSQKDQEVLRRAAKEGIAIAIATGRAYSELPVEMFSDMGIHYAITGNGGGIYRMPKKECLASTCIETEILCEVLEKIQQLEVYLDIYVDGVAYCDKKAVPIIYRMDMPPAIHDFIAQSRVVVEDLVSFVKENQAKAEKVTVNFAMLEDGSFLGRDETARILDSYPQFSYLCGGYHNWEFTVAGIDKGEGLRFLANVLGISMEHTMACGDSANDLAMMKSAKVAVAMQNAIESIKKEADFITFSNKESGVGYVIEKIVL